MAPSHNTTVSQRPPPKSSAKNLLVTSPSVASPSTTSILTTWSSEIESYAITDRNLIDVEKIAQREIKYSSILTEETVFLANDPEQRDRVIAQLYQNPKVQQGVSPQTLVNSPGCSNAHEYLAWVDHQLEREAETFEDHVLRAHIAFAGCLVFEDYVKQFGLHYFPDLLDDVNKLVADWLTQYSMELEAEQQRRARDAPPYWAQFLSHNVTPSSSTSSKPIDPLATYLQYDAPRRLTTKDVESMASNPIGTEISRYCFKTSDIEDTYRWRFIGVEAGTRGRAVYAIDIKLEEGGGGILPHSREAFIHLLKQSEIIGELKDDSESEDRGFMFLR